MYKKETKQRLCDLLIEFGAEEKHIEVLRQILCENGLFEPYLMFRKLDRTNTKLLNAEDLIEFLSCNGVYHNEKNVSLYINHYDLDYDNKLSYTEFLNSILPQDNNELREAVALRNNEKSLEDKINYEIEYSLSRLIDREINYYLRFDSQKKLLFNCQDFTIESAFNTITNQEIEYINFDNLKGFFKKNDYDINDNEILLIMRRIDLKAEGKIIFDDFKYALLIKSYDYPDDKKINNYEIIKNNKKNKKIQENEQTVDELLNCVRKNKKYSCVSCYPNPKNQDLDIPFINDRKKYSTLYSKYSKKQINDQDFEELKLLIEFFKEIIKYDKSVEDIKQNLAMNYDFTLMGLFRFFDKLNQGILTKREMEDVFNEIGLSPSKDELYLFIRKYDIDCDGRLRYSDFIECFLPKEKEYANLLNKRKEIGEIKKELKFNQVFLKETRNLLINLFQEQFYNEITIESCKQELFKRNNFNLQRIFDILDEDEDGYLTLCDLNNLFNSDDKFVTEKELLFLLDRFDRDNDSFISYVEFLNEMQPKFLN